MAGDGVEFDVNLGVTGGDAASSAADALAALSEKLTLAGNAATVASDALKAGEASYAAAETSADRAAKALERIGLQADAQRGKLAAALETGDTSGADRAAAKLGNLLERQAEAQSKADQAAAALNEEAASLDRLKTAAQAAADNEAALSKQSAALSETGGKAGGALDDVSDAAEGGSVNMRALSAGFGKLGGPLGRAGSQAAGFASGLQRLSSQLGEAGPYVAAAVLVVAIATAVVGATIAIAAWGIANADAARTSALLSAGIAGTVAGGKQLDETFHRLEGTIPLSRQELSSMASDLAKTGLKGDALSAALETAATKAAKLKYGPEFAKQTLSLDSQTTRLKANIAGVFGGLKIESLLAGLSKVVALFDETSTTGLAMKAIFEGFFQPVIDSAVAMLPKVVAAFIQIEILVLKAAIAIKPYSAQIKLLGEGFAVLAAIVVGVLAVALAAAIIPLVFIVATVASVIAGIIALGDVISDTAGKVDAFAGSLINDAIGAFTQLQTAGQGVLDWFSNLSLAEIGSALIAGLAQGITGSAGTVVSAVTGVASDAITAAKNALGIHSPSTVFAEIGENTGAGMSVGVDSASDGVQASLNDLVQPPAQAAGGGASSGTRGDGGGAGHTFNFYGVKDAEDARDMFLAALEEVGGKLGGAVAA